MKNQKQIHNQKGFTLIEMAIVIVIIGLVIASVAQLLQQRQRFIQVETTQVAIADATDAIVAFRDNFGRYPCPASLNATPTNNPDRYGVESDDGNPATPLCSDVGSVAINTGVDAAFGYAVVAGQRPVTYWDRSVTPPVEINATPRVRIGALPFKNLNMQESESYDGYRNRILYAVVEPLAVRKTFDNNAGAIEVRNAQDTSALEPANSAHFIILSAGENGAGAFTRGGARLACAAGSQESQNCDFDVDSIFRFAEAGTQNNGSAATYDDVISFATHEQAPLWEIDPADVGAGNPGSLDVNLKTVGDIGIGGAASLAPTEDLHIRGTLITRDDPSTPETEGNIEANAICEYTSGTTTCFPSNLIAGNLEAGDGMSCPPGEFMTGIQNGAPVCSDEVKIECPAGQFAVGIDANGRLDCNTPPLPGCGSEAFTLCPGGESGLVPASDHGVVRDITVPTTPGNPGGERHASYRCDAGTWKLVPGSVRGDPCGCTPGVSGQSEVLCRTNNKTCGERWEGTMLIETTTSCPSGDQSSSTDRSGCICIETVGHYTQSCNKGMGFPSGTFYNRGIRRFERTHDCSIDPPACSPAVEVDSGDPCRCEETAVENRNRSCPNGLTGKIPQTRQYTCPDGPGQPGVRSAWTPSTSDPDAIAAHCSCVARDPYTEEQNCVDDGGYPAGYIGTYKVRITESCDPADPTAPPVKEKTVLLDTCAPAGSATCEWKQDGPGNLGYNPSAPALGTPCNDKCGMIDQICRDGDSSAQCACQ